MTSALATGLLLIGGWAAGLPAAAPGPSPSPQPKLEVHGFVDVSYAWNPMSYAAQMGGVCTLIGTSTNLLVDSIARAHGHPGFSLFEFSGLGLITMAAGFTYVLLIGYRLLPERRQAELSDTYELGKYVTELRVLDDSPLVGQSVAEAKLAERHGAYVLELLRGDEQVWSPRAQRLQAGDVLLVRGDWQRLTEMREETKLALEPEFRLRDAQFDGPDQVLTEAMVAPGSWFVGHSLRELDFQWHYNATVLAIQRRGQVLRQTLREVRLDVGDVLLMLARSEELPHLRRNRNLILLSTREEATQPRRRSGQALAIMLAVVLGAAAGLLPIVTAAILGAVAMVLSRCIEAEEVYEAIDWRVIVLLAGMLPLGIALEQSGAAQLLVDRSLAGLGDRGPLLALAVMYLLTAALTEAMSNNAAAVLLAPIALATAEALGVSATPFLVAVAFAASTSFATPVGYQTNTMVYSVGGYRFGDFLRIGLPLNGLFWALAVWLIPRLFPF